MNTIEKLAERSLATADPGAAAAAAAGPNDAEGANLPASTTPSGNEPARGPESLAERPLVEVDDIAKVFDVSAPWLNRVLERKPRLLLHAVDGVSFTIRRGETLALVGESGCGKSTVARMLVGLYKPSRGSVKIDGHDLSELSGPSGQALRRRIQMIFQDPYASLNPRWKVSEIIAEPIRVHRLLDDEAAIEARVGELLRHVGLSPTDASRFPHQFSGGQRQRIGIARALALNPSFIVADEPITSLDVSIQAQVVNLLEDLQDEFGLTYLFIAHDLSVVRHISDRVAVMYLGKMVELADRDAIYDEPLHPYTKALLSAVPVPDPVVERKRERIILSGDVPSPINPPSGCHFHTRCPYVMDVCRKVEPRFVDQGGGHFVACHLYPNSGA